MMECIKTHVLTTALIFCKYTALIKFYCSLAVQHLSPHSFLKCDCFRESSNPSGPALVSKENPEGNLHSNDTDEAFQREWSYCTGEIDFFTSGKKKGKVAQNVSFQI